MILSANSLPSSSTYLTNNAPEATSVAVESSLVFSSSPYVKVDFTWLITNLLSTFLKYNTMFSSIKILPSSTVLITLLYSQINLPLVYLHTFPKLDFSSSISYGNKSSIKILTSPT